MVSKVILPLFYLQLSSPPPVSRETANRRLEQAIKWTLIFLAFSSLAATQTFWRQVGFE